MKKIIFPAAFAVALAFAATDASAQQTIGQGTSSDRPMPTNSEITESEEKRQTNGKPMEQIRANETDSPRNRNQPQQDIDRTTRNRKVTPATQPVDPNRSRTNQPVAPVPAPAR